MKTAAAVFVILFAAVAVADDDPVAVKAGRRNRKPTCNG